MSWIWDSKSYSSWKHLVAGATYSWTFNGGTIPGANSYTYTATQAGDYGVIITYPTGCQITDTPIAYLPAMNLVNPVVYINL